MWTLASNTKGVVYFETAGHIWFHKLKGLGGNYVVYMPWGRFFEGRIGPAVVEPIFTEAVESTERTERKQQTVRYMSNN